MATVSAPNLTHTSNAPLSPSPPIKGLKKVLSGRRRSSEFQNDSLPSARQSDESLILDRNVSVPSPRASPNRDGSISSGVHKLIPGHNKRQRQKMREAELKSISQEPIQRGRTPEPSKSPPPGAVAQNRSTSSLLTDGSENDTPPPLVSRNSHLGYFTTSSPLLSNKAPDNGQNQNGSDVNLAAMSSVEAFPVIVAPDQNEEGTVSPKSTQLNLAATPVLPIPASLDRVDTLRADQPSSRRGSISKLRAKSPARKIRDVFSRSSRSPRVSPERESNTSIGSSDAALAEQTSIAERRLADNPDKSPPPPLKNSNMVSQQSLLSPVQPLALETDISPPRTPPSARLTTPMTTVTPPTPTDVFRQGIVASPKRTDEVDDNDGNNIDDPVESVSAPSLHRRVRSGSSSAHPKSKLSASMTVPLTPTIEEPSKTPGEKPAGGRSFTPSSGFFSSWVSAAQNAASSISGLTAPARSRASTAQSDSTKVKLTDENDQTEKEIDDSKATKKQLAVETLGSGDLDLSQLGIEGNGDDRSSTLSRLDRPSLRKKTDLQRDEAQAKVEDILAKRAVSAAYEDPSESTPVAEISDPLASMRRSQPFDVSASGTLTPPNGSIHEVDSHPVKRSNSVRSKLANRRSRGSSVATGQSTLGLSGAAASSSTVVPTGPRLTAFTPAPKQRNRGFHQQFRSVPEDDNLIEDYSCALQKEILLAGRIYISEGHICFSSNILGWVTTLIISFEEIVSIERENTAMIIPNAIAIQTLHARHTFRSLLSREATFDLIIGIWKVNHPASFSKSVNGKQMVAEQAQHDAEKALGAKAQEEADSDVSSNEDDESDDDDHDHDSAPSVVGSNHSTAGSDFLDAKSVTRQPSGTNGALAIGNGVAPVGSTGDVVGIPTTASSTSAAPIDFPGPLTHAPTDCSDSATHYDKIIKDEIISAPLGKIYSLLYGPQSGNFVRKYLVDECKCLELALEDDKKGLSNEAKSRQYSYIKPLGGSIGPKQTKCITTENLDFFDLEKSVSVTCTTQTPDVPSGSAFATKTRYCLSWAPGNATRLQMNCTIEWSAKSWLKGPIEKGANDGQQQYGDGLVKALKAALGRSRGGTTGSKGAKTKKKKKGEKKNKSEQREQDSKQNKDWGIFEPIRSTVEPVLDIVRPAAKMEVIVTILSIMTIFLWFGGSSRGNRHVGYPGLPLNQVERLTAYEQLWHREESALWDWLEDRAGVDRIVLGPAGSATAGSDRKDPSKNRQRVLRDKTMAARLQAEKWSRKEMQEAVRVTRQRLDEMQRILDKKAA